VAWFGNETGSSLPDSDRATVDRAKAGDADAFGELVRTYQHRLVNYAGAIMSNRSDAEDVAQEAFLRAFRALGQFRGQSLFKTWLYQIATNVARTHLDKRRSRAEDLAGDPAASPERFNHPISSDNVESAYAARDRIDRALGALPSELREAVVLRDVEGLDYKEIAVALGIPIGTVESRIFRARQRLKALLGQP